MNEQTNNILPTNKDNQAIKAIYEMLAQAFPDKNIQREPFTMSTVGHLGFVNPGTKNIYNALQKLDRKIRTKSDRENNVEMSDIIQRDFYSRDADLFDVLSDWSRFAIILPNFECAAEVVEMFLIQFGGKIDIHEREDYQAIHLHTNYKDVNLEFQFYTKEYAELKKATDIFYHQYNNVVVIKNSQIEDQKRMLEDKIKEHCKSIYQGSGFIECIPAVKNVYENFKSQNLKTHTPKLSHFCEYVKKADMVQSELDKFLPTFMEPMNNLETIQNFQQTINKSENTTTENNL